MPYVVKSVNCIKSVNKIVLALIMKKKKLVIVAVIIIIQYKYYL